MGVLMCVGCVRVCMLMCVGVCQSGHADVCRGVSEWAC